MAVLTDVCRIHMRRVLTGGIDAIVATEAIARDVRVVENRRYPKRTCVAIVALVAGNDMARWFAGRLRAVVARTAASRHRCVVHVKNRTPGRCRVAA